LRFTAVAGEREGPGAFRPVCRFEETAVSGETMDQFGLSPRVAPCVSPLTEGAQSECSRWNVAKTALIFSTEAG